MSEFKLRTAHRDDESDLSSKTPYEEFNPEFIPFAGYYNPNTIITKNGELLKVIKITGFNHEDILSGAVNLRETIRDTLLENIKTDDFALWITTIRRKKDIVPDGQFQDFFSQKLDEFWNEEHNWHEQYINELYITIIIEGYDTSIKNIGGIFHSLSFRSTKRLHRTQLAQSHKKLDVAVKNIMQDLNSYGARLIGIRKVNGQLYSEPMHFFGKILHLDENHYPLSTMDMSDELACDYKIAFGNNILSVSGSGKESAHYATILSIKEYQEISLGQLDKFLQLPQEFIITQSVDFINRNTALMELDYQNYILDVSRDSYTREISGLENIIAGDSGSLTDYGKQQITIMLLNKTNDGLSKDINIALAKLRSLGVVAIREDIFSEPCFWHQTPGNFSFSKRQKAINIDKIAGFASLHNFPAGSKSGNHWGEAVTIFHTVLGTPYFFNFHYYDKGHTVIIGPYGSGKTVLLNFLISQSRRFNNKIYYFGNNLSGKIFINAIEGHYLSLNKNLDHSESLKMNPLALENNENNRDFLIKWFGCLINEDLENNSEKKQSIQDIVEKILQQNIKTLAQAAEICKNLGFDDIYQKLAPWHSQGKLSFIFDHDIAINFNNGLINAFDLTPIINKKSILIPIVTYLLHKIEEDLDGSPTILVLDEAWQLLDNYAIGPYITDFLKRLQEKNCIVIFATESPDKASTSNITSPIHDNIATQIFLPDPKPGDYYTDIFGLNQEEFMLLSQMNSNDRHFLLKHGGDAIIANLDLSKVQNISSILSSTPENIFAMDELKKEYGTKASDWVPKFLELMQEIAQEEQDSDQ